MGKDLRIAELARWIQAELDARQWDQADLVRRSSGALSGAQLSRVLSGERNAGLDFMLGVAKGFGVPNEAVLRVVGVLSPLAGTDRVTELLERCARLPEHWREFVLTSWEGALLVAEQAPVDRSA